MVLAPMAGITNAAYRRLCLEQMQAQGSSGLFVCEMITSRGLVEGDATTRQMLVFDEQEQVRSVQLYGTDPAYVGKATEILCAEYGVAHVDLNFGCPVPKVTRKGGGAALPWKRTLLGEILQAAVAAAGALRRAGDDEDAQGHRRGPPHLPRRRTDRPGVGGRGDRPARAHRRPGVLRHRRLGRDHPPGRARGDPGARQRRHLGGRRRPADGRADRSRRRRRRPRLPGPALALPRPRRRLRARSAVERSRDHTTTLPTPRRGRRDDVPPRRAAVAPHGGGARLQGVPQARHLVPQGVPRRRATCAATSPWSTRSPSSTPCWPGSTRRRPSRCTSWALREAARAAPAGASPCRRDGWRTPTAPGASYGRTRPRPQAADQRERRAGSRFGRRARRAG